MQSIGQFLRHEREVRQVSIEELSQTTRIPVRMLERIERDRFEELPGEVFVRGFLKSYARALGLPDEAILDRYALERGPSDVRTTPILPVIAPERGRRFGIAIALVILLILFTLALSIVLRPRAQDLPNEISLAPANTTAVGASG
ncbi:MAG: helix-turn-helix domain-containing protein [Deltaproteobacteria bacterium]|nr:helix-turn-helix domain-containing protein [Deltaproteobacteria bacterium]